MNTKEKEKLFEQITGENYQEFCNELRPKLSWFLATHYLGPIQDSKKIIDETFTKVLGKINGKINTRQKLITLTSNTAKNITEKQLKNGEIQPYWKNESKSN